MSKSKPSGPRALTSENSPRWRHLEAFHRGKVQIQVARAFLRPLEIDDSSRGSRFEVPLSVVGDPALLISRVVLHTLVQNKLVEDLSRSATHVRLTTEQAPDLNGFFPGSSIRCGTWL